MLADEPPAEQRCRFLDCGADDVASVAIGGMELISRIEALLRKNLFEHILQRPGARAVPGSPGEAISRFRDDVAEISNFMAESLILLGFGTFALVALGYPEEIKSRPERFHPEKVKHNSWETPFFQE